jgi:hypothetical protein
MQGHVTRDGRGDLAREIIDSSNFVMSRAMFRQEITANRSTVIRPLRSTPEQIPDISPIQSTVFPCEKYGLRKTLAGAPSLSRKRRMLITGPRRLPSYVPTLNAH